MAKEFLIILHYSLLSKDGIVANDKILAEHKELSDYIMNTVPKFTAAIKESWGACVLVLEIVTFTEEERIIDDD